MDSKNSNSNTDVVQPNSRLLGSGQHDTTTRDNDDSGNTNTADEPGTNFSTVTDSGDAKLHKRPRRTLKKLLKTTIRKDKETLRQPLVQKKSQIVSDFVDRVSIAGLPQIHSGVYPGRIIWLLIFLIFTVLTAFQIANLFIRYFKYEVKTSTTIGYNTLAFPTVTLCNLNPLRQSQTHLDHELHNFLEGLKISSQLSLAPSQQNADTQPRNNQRRRRDDRAARESASASVPDYNVETTDNNDNIVQQPPQQQQQYEEPDSDMDYYSYYDNDESHDDYVIYDNNEYTDDVRNDEEIAAGNLTRDEDVVKYKLISPGLKHHKELMKLLGKVESKERLKMAHQKEIMILWCSYGSEKCTAKNFSAVISDDYNYCYQFNGPADRTMARNSTGIGPNQGLTLVLYAEGLEKLKGFTQTKGFRVEIHPFKALSFPWTNGFYVSPGFETNVAIKLKNVERLGGKYGECVDDETFLKRFDRLYTKATCDLVCFDQLIASQCKCARKSFRQRYTEAQLNTMPQCNVSSQAYKSCYDQLKELREHGYLDEQCGCLRECSLTEFVASRSAVTWPDETLWSYLVSLVCNQNSTDMSPFALNATIMNCRKLKELNAEQDVDVAKKKKQDVLRGNFALLKIYFSEWNYELITESPEYDANALLADLGGSGGLYLGMSIFTGLELALFCCELTISCCKHRRKRTNNNDNEV